MKRTLLDHSAFGIAYGVLNYECGLIYFFYLKHEFAHLKSCNHAEQDVSIGQALPFFAESAIRSKLGDSAPHLVHDLIFNLS